MSISSNSRSTSRPLHTRRMPVYRTRDRRHDDRATVPYVRSPSADSKVIIARRRASTPPTSNVHIVEVQSPDSPAYVKRVYPGKRMTRVIREQSPLSTTSDPASTIISPPSSLAPRWQHERRIVRLATASTSTSSNGDLIIHAAPRTRRALIETPVAIVSETPLVNRGTSPRKLWKKRGKTIPLDVDRDVYISDEDYYEEAFSDGVSITFSKRLTCITFNHDRSFISDVQA
jgi:hypothetical protein